MAKMKNKMHYFIILLTLISRLTKPSERGRNSSSRPNFNQSITEYPLSILNKIESEKRVGITDQETAAFSYFESVYLTFISIRNRAN